MAQWDGSVNADMALKSGPNGSPSLNVKASEDIHDVHDTENLSVSSDSERDEPNKRLLGENDVPITESETAHTTTNMQALMNLLKGNIGTGIMALPSAFKYGGLWLGFFGIFFTGTIAVHCMHILVACAQHIRRRTGSSSVDYGEVVRQSFSMGPAFFRQFANTARNIVNLFLCITQFGFCTIYILFIANNIRQVLEAFTPVHTHLWVYQLFIALALIPYLAIRQLKLLAPFSLIANALMVVGLIITLQYCFHDIPPVTDRPAIGSLKTLPLYFGIAIFAFEGIGVVLPIENKMKTPQDFGGWVGVLNLGMVIAMVAYAAVGFYGYLKFGDAVLGSITLNLPCHEGLYAAVKIMFAIAIFFTFGIQFYVPIEILWPPLMDSISVTNTCLRNFGEYLLRLMFLIITYILAATIPHLDLMISLVGALASSAVALIFPPLLELVTFWSEPEYLHKWRIVKDVLIILVGFLGFFIGTVTTIMAIVEAFHSTTPIDPC